MNSLQRSYIFDESSHVEFNEHINSLNNSLISRLQSLDNMNPSLHQILHHIPVVFRFLHKNVESQKKLSDEYNHLSNITQNIISIFAQYIHDRHNHENELLLLKDKISQVAAQIGYTQYCLEQYWTMIHSLECEIVLLQIHLSNPQLLNINKNKSQVFQENQKLQLDRFMKESEKLKISITKQKDAIQVVQRQIEGDLKELKILKLFLQKIKLEQTDTQNHWSQIGLFIKKTKTITVD